MADLVMVFEGVGKVNVRLRPEKTDTVSRLLAAVPFSSKSQRWGNEIYFDCPFHAEPEGDARQDMDVGEVAYWPEGDALAVFFGRTPASRDGRPRAYSPCNILGRVEGDLSMLPDVRPGARVDVRRP